MVEMAVEAQSHRWKCARTATRRLHAPHRGGWWGAQARRFVTLVQLVSQSGNPASCPLAAGQARVLAGWPRARIQSVSEFWIMHA